MSFLHAFGMFLARICVSAIFILAGIGKFINYEDTVQYMASKSFTMIPLFLVAAALVEIIGGLSVLFGFKIRWGATLLLLFLIPTSIIFHDFWNLYGAEKQSQMIEFLKNLSIFGGLIYVLLNGAGKFSIDALLTKNSDYKK